MTPPHTENLPLSPEQRLQREQAERLLEAWRIPSGWRRVSEVNNSVVGIWYITAAIVFLIFGGLLALLMRIQLAFPNNTFLSAEAYNQVFTLHGSVMMFLFAVPIFEALSISLLPQMLGARELPFPRLSAFGFWCFVIGGAFLCGSLFFGAAPNGGWFMYPPLTSSYEPGIGADIWLLGFSFIEIAAIAASVELIVGVLKFRAPGMRINLIPLYSWYVLVAGAMILFAFPPLIAGDLLLELERAFGWPFFNPSGGGDPLLWQHLFWIFGHPEVYIIFLPSIALVAMMIPTFARTPMSGYSWIVLSAIGTGFLSFGLWVHHMFTTGLPGVSLALFSAASQAVAIPTGVQIFCFIATLLVGRVQKSLPLLFIFGGLATFVIGGLTGVMVAVAPFDFQAHDTHFVVAHLHSVLIGGALFPFAAAMYYYFPVLKGKRLSEKLGRITFWLMFIGFNLTFLPMHFTGLRGMPRRVFTYPDGIGLETLNLVSTIGAFVLAGGLAVLFYDLFRKKPGVSARDPWRAGTLEWLQEIPGRPWGSRSIPEISSRYPLWEQTDLVKEVDGGRCFLPDAEEGRRETIVTSVIDAQPVECMRLPGPTFLTILAAAFTGAAFVLGTFKQWSWAGVAGAIAVAAIVRWLWTGSAEIPEKKDKHVGRGIRLPLYVSGPDSVGWWAMLITMLAVMTAFISVVFGYFFYWTLRPGSLIGSVKGPGVFWPVTGLGLLVTAWGLMLAARRWNRIENAPAFYAASAIGALITIAGSAALLSGPVSYDMDPSVHAYSAVVWLLLLWTVVQAVVGVLMNLYCIARRWAGRMTGCYDIDIQNVTLYWHFVALTALVAVVTVSGFPLLQ